MQDYQGNSKRERVAEGGSTPAKPEKKVQKVVVTEVVVKKKGLGRKIKDTIIAADIRGVFRYVLAEVFVPAAKDMLFDGLTKGVQKTIYGESAVRRHHGFSTGPRITYNNPINRGPTPARFAPTPHAGPRSRQTDDFVLTSRDDAEMVLERLNDIIDKYEVASVGDLHELMGISASHVDQKWGWVYLGDVQVRQVREGYLIDLPPAEPINQ